MEDSSASVSQSMASEESTEPTAARPVTTLNVAVLGGLIADHIMITNRLPDLGETFKASSYDRALGGKGADAAIGLFRSFYCKPTLDGDLSTARRALNDVDVNVRMIAAAGDDGYAQQFRDEFALRGVDGSAIRSVPGKSTAQSVIIIDEDTRLNRILSYPGANHALLPEDFTTAESLGNGVRPDLVVCSLEFQVATVERILDVAYASNVDVVLNAAPADHILLEKYPYITHLIVNETEAAILSGLDVDELKALTVESWITFAKKFLEEGVKNVVITLGEVGAVYANRDGAEGHACAYEVTAVDTTGAGDSFTAVYAAEHLRQKTMQEDWNIHKAVVRACKAAALCVTGLNSWDPVPWADEIESMDAAPKQVLPKVDPIDAMVQ